MSIPLYGFLQGDTMGLVIVVQEDEKVSDLVKKMLLASSVRVRPPAPSSPMKVIYKDQILDLKKEISQVGFAPLERVDIRFADSTDFENENKNQNA